VWLVDAPGAASWGKRRLDALEILKDHKGAAYPMLDKRECRNHGGGHNGGHAFYLAKADTNRWCSHAVPQPCGSAITEEFHPGFAVILSHSGRPAAC